MSEVKVDASGLADAIMGALNDYNEKVKKDINEAAKEASEYCKEQIENNAATAFGGTGEYSKSWTIDTVYENGNVNYVVHSKAPYYRLTHLLEYAHAHWLWGREQIPWKGRPHIRPAEKLTIKKFEQDIKARLQK